MKVVVRFTLKQETKALPIILRGSPGMILKNRTYILSEDVVRKLRAAKVKFTEISREATREGAVIGERV